MQLSRIRNPAERVRSSRGISLLLSPVRGRILLRTAAISASTLGYVLLGTLSTACQGGSRRAPPGESRESAAAAAGVPCVFTGHWDAILKRPRHVVRGTLDINTMPDSSSRGVDPRWRRWRGRYDIEWWRLWAPKEGLVSSTSTGAGSQQEIRHGILASAVGDTVSITLSPLTSHGPISLWGVWLGDTIRGVWHQRSVRLVPAKPGALNADVPPHGTVLLTRPPTSCGKRAT